MLRRVLLCCLSAAFAWVGSASAQTPAPNLARTYILRRLLIGDSEQSSLDLLKADGSKPLLVKGVPVLLGKDFPAAIAKYYGKPITNASVHDLGQTIIGYVQKHDRPVVNVVLPPQYQQDIAQGIFRLVVRIGHYNELVMKGNHWFSRNLLMSELGIRPGDEIRYSVLDSAVNWANTNPYRKVQVLINMVNMAPGQADLDVAVIDRFPARLAFSYDNTGNQYIGIDHYTAAFQYANLFGLDQQLSYQFTTTDNIHEYQAHGFEYKAPLPWHHYLDLTLGYTIVHPEILGGQFTEPGKDYVADLRYVVPISYKGWAIEASAGVDYKQLDNSLFFNLSNDVTAPDYYRALNTINSIAQLTLGTGGIRHDSHGAWGFSSNFVFSPGNFNARNTNATFGQVIYPPGFFNADGSVNLAVADNLYTQPSQPPRFGAVARYVYWTGQAQRLTTLPHDFQLYDRVVGQLSSANLLSSEEMSIGGAATVRGYDERIESGDEGWFVSHEFRMPELRRHLGFLRPKAGPLEMRFLAFWDYGHVYDKIDFPGADAGNKPLMSSGIGLRSNIGSHFTLGADYGWQILRTENPEQPDHSRGDITATLSY